MDALLKKFNENRIDTKFNILQRASIEQDYKFDEHFSVDLKDYDSCGQYYKFYQTRLRVLKERTRNQCLKKWDAGFKLNGKTVVEKKKVLDIQANQPCWCIGTIYCEMKYKPNVLEEVVNDTYGAPDLLKSYTDPDGTDEIMLEDESGRVLLVGDFLQSTPFVTGTVVGLLGMEAEAGTFQILDICYPSEVPQKEYQVPTSDEEKYIALVSGLNVSTNNPENLIKLQLLQELLMGRLQNEKSISNIGKLLICGGSIDPSKNNSNSQKTMESLITFGNFLGNTLQSLPISIMPSTSDPSDKALPQRPFNKILFSELLKPYFADISRDLLHLATNPSIYEFNGIRILATSGENISDICRYVIPGNSSENESKLNSVEHRLDLMECTLKWQNVAPTIPDTLWAYPFIDKDPFILNEMPHVYIAGNQPRFGTRDIELYNKKVKLICLPEFNKSSSLVTLNLKTLMVEKMDIKI
ncbi:hypothetical protein TPHA_0J03100 [Tetrapisispora phaffii CBS 4417]|uniref:DNA polymerase alpha/delta/epsilon subunit B domain-containing protein n=1 Tax=Tetrapisispora phaffii (strain ATCC 24235 / CBS 4417 / NBRC 1672 / NRRL Y-8282 / UCD 70-5) TaxID=1071381 RepID=G8BY79_TETPH|nr:hypothetical protein TPHA_0J03100 [Tetrapisispora phaffii CBS 4417]CCE65130.1 hypothetical protein TPHA_0J03100 [Tetrapisispora phaffii CBS 4417]